MALVVGVDAVARIGEPDRSVRMLNDIVRAVEPVFLVRGCQHRDRAVVLCSGNPTPAMLTGHESATAINGAAVAKAGRRQENVGTVAHFVVSEHPIIGAITEQHETACGVVRRSLQPSPIGKEAGNLTVAASSSEPRIEYLELGRDEIRHGSSSLSVLMSVSCGDSIDISRKAAWLSSASADVTRGAVAQPVRAGDS